MHCWREKLPKSPFYIYGTINFRLERRSSHLFTYRLSGASVDVGHFCCFRPGIPQPSVDYLVRSHNSKQFDLS